MRIFVFIECVVKFEIDVLNILGDAIDFDFGFVNNNFWIRCAYAIDNALIVLFVKEWALSHVYANVHLRGTDMVQSSTDIFLLIFNQLLKINVDKALTSSGIHSLSLCLINFHCFHFGSPLLALLLNFLNSSHFFDKYKLSFCKLNYEMKIVFYYIS